MGEREWQGPPPKPRRLSANWLCRDGQRELTSQCSSVGWQQFSNCLLTFVADHVHMSLKSLFYGLCSNLGSIVWVYKIVLTLSSPVNSKASGLLCWNRRAVFGKENYENCHVFMLVSSPAPAKKKKGGEQWLKCMKHLERTRASLPEVLSWSPRRS